MVFGLVLTTQTAPIKIFTYAYNRPEFVEWQYKTFKKFMLDDYTFTVFNDASNQTHLRQIEDICAKYGIQCIRIPQEIHNKPYLKRWPGESYNSASVRNCNVVQYSMDNYGFGYDGIVMMLDSDMFLTRPFSVTKYMAGYDISGLAQSRPSVNYLAICLVFMDMRTLPNQRTLNWNCGIINGEPVDSAGHTHFYLKDNPSVRVKYMSHVHTFPTLCQTCQEKENYGCTHNQEYLERIGLDEMAIGFMHSGPVNIEFNCDHAFLHYRGATWDKKTPEYHRKKTNLIEQYINTLLNN